MASLYDQTIPVMVKYFENLSALLTKATEHCTTTGTKQEDMLNFKVNPSMKPLSYHVQGPCNTAKFLIHRVAAHENIYFPDDETTLDQLQSRIATTVKLIQSVDPQALNDKIDKPIIMTLKMGSFKFASGQAYVSNYALPNFHGGMKFAYENLSAQGVPVTPFDLFAGLLEKAD